MVAMIIENFLKRKEQIITENNDSNPGLLQFLRTLAQVFFAQTPEMGGISLCYLDVIPRVKSTLYDIAKNIAFFHFKNTT
ncbi:hypothetical protein ACT7C6_08350 [Bacillus paranthracis]